MCWWAILGSDSSFHVGDEAMLEYNLLLLRRLLPAAPQRLWFLAGHLRLRLALRLPVSDDASIQVGFRGSASGLQCIDTWQNSVRDAPRSLPEALCALQAADLFSYFWWRQPLQ